MSKVLEGVRALSPAYADAPADKLVLAVGSKYPVYLDQDPEFAREYANAREKADILSGIRERNPEPSTGSEVIQAAARATWAPSPQQPDPNTQPLTGLHKSELELEQARATSEADKAALAATVWGHLQGYLNEWTPASMAERLGQFGNYLGNVGQGLMKDWLADRIPTPWNPNVQPILENTGRALAGEGPPPPDVVTNAAGQQEPDRRVSSIEQGLLEGAHSLGPLAVMMAATRLGLPAPAAGALAFGASAYAATGNAFEGARAAAIGAVIPEAGAVGRQVAANALTEAIERGALEGASPLALKFGEALGAQGGMQAFMEGMALPEYLELPPEDRLRAVQKSLVAGLALGALSVEELASRQPSLAARQVSPGRRVSQAIDELVENPEFSAALRQAADDEAFLRAQPGAAGETAKRRNGETARPEMVEFPPQPFGGRIEDLMGEPPPTRGPVEDYVEPEPTETVVKGEEFEGKGPGRREQGGIGEAAPAADTVPQTMVEGYPTVEIPLEALTLSKEVPQFKSNANAKGIVEPLQGKFNRIGLAPIQVWRRMSKVLEIISGRHRFDLAQRSGERTIPSQIHDEAAGFDARSAARLDAELNIQDEKGTIADYANYFRNSDISPTDAEARGLLARAKGKAGFAIGRGASEDLFALHQGGRITDAQAEVIARLAPGNEGLQAVGVRAALKDQSPETISDIMTMAQQMASRRAAEKAQGDLFGFDDSAIRQMEEQSAKASAERLVLREQVQAVKGAARKPDVAKKLGVDVQNPEGLKERIQEIESRIDALRRNPMLAGAEPKSAKQEGGEDAKGTQSKPPKLRSGEKGTGELFQGADTPFNLAGEKAKDFDRIAAEKAAEEKKAAEAKEIADRQQRQLFGGKGEGAAKAEAAPAATIEQATLPRRIEAPKLTPGTPVSLADIRKYLAQALDIPIRLGVKIPKGIKGALGFFRPKQETIRVRALNDIPTIAHEVGHYLHFILFPDANPRTKLGIAASKFAGAFDGELLAMGARTSKASYSAQQVRMEGVAEFFREWLTDPAQALAHAPTFHAFFEAELANRYPEIWKIVQRARADVARYIAQPAVVKVASMISWTPERPETGLRNVLRKWYDNWVDEIAPLHRAQRYLDDLGLAPDEQYRFARFAVNFLGGWRGKAEHTLRRRQLSYAGQDVGPSLSEILRPVEDLDEFAVYLTARRAQEIAGRRLNGKRVETGIERADADEVVKQLGAKYQAVESKLRGFIQHELALLRDAGMISTAEMDRIAAANQLYVKFRRVEPTPVAGRGGTGQGFIDVPKPLRRFTGGSSRIANPLESLVADVYMYREAAERNRVGRAFIDAIETVRGAGRVGESLAVPVKPVKVSHDEMLAQLKRAGILDIEGVEEFLDANDIDLTFKLWRQRNPASAKRGVFNVWVGGKERPYQVDDPELYRALKLQDSVDAQMMAKVPLAQFFANLTRLKRAGATLTLEFIARNPFRDQFAAAINSNYGFVPFFDGFRGMLAAMGKGDLYWQWVRSGGRYSDFMSMDRRDLILKLKDVARSPLELTNLAKWLNPITTLQHASELMEQATRLSEFRRALAAGASEVEAANASKDVSLNYARSGFKGKLVNMFQAFYNASMQDIDKTIRSHREHPLRTAAKGFLYVSLPSILAWHLGKDDPEIQQLPAWRKLWFWNVNLRDVAKLAGKDMAQDWVISLPKPFLYGALYGNSVEAALDLAHQRDPNAVVRWLGSVVQQTPLPWDPFEWQKGGDFGSSVRWETLPVPGIVTTLAESVGKYSTFRHQPLIPSGLDALPARWQATPDTSQASRALAGLMESAGLPISPILVDNAVRGIFAGLGRYGLDAIDYALTKTALAKLPPPPAKGVGEMPVLRAFLQGPYAPSADVERFYAALKIAEQRVALLQGAAKMMVRGAEKTLWDRERAALTYYLTELKELNGRSAISVLREGRAGLGLIHQAMTLVQNAPSMAPAEKREKLTALSRERNARASDLYNKVIWPADRARVY